MKRMMLIFLCAVIVGITGTVGAVSINYDYLLSADDTLTTPYSWATVETFDGDLLWTWSGSGEVVSGALSGKYAAPYNNVLMLAADQTNYVTVPDPDGGSSGAYAADLGGTYNYFGIFWGSVDTYNTLSFFNGGSQVASYNGSAITTPNVANGNQSAPYSNLYVNFLDLPAFDSFMMTSTNFAFEADNIAVGTTPVPEPASLMLMLGGLSGVAFIRKRKV